MKGGRLIVSRGVFTRNLFSNWASLLCDVAVAIFLTPFIIHSLGLALYGVWSFVNSIIGAMGIADFGIRGSTQRFINQAIAHSDDDELNEVVSTATTFLTLISLFLIAVSLLLGAYFTDLFPKTPRELEDIMVIVTPLLALNLSITFITSVHENILMSIERFEVVNGIRITSLFLRTALVVWMLLDGYGFLGLIAASLAASVYSLAVSVFYSFLLHRPLHISRRYISRQRFSQMWRYGIAVFVVRTADNSVLQADQLIIMVFLGPREIGIYSIAVMLITYVQKLVYQITVTWIPSVLKSASVHDFGGLRSIFYSNARLALMLGTLCYVGLIVYSDTFILLWLGSEYTEAYLLTVVIAAAELVSLLASTSRMTMFGLDKMRTAIVLALAYTLSNIALSVFFVAALDMGLIGIVFGTLLSAVTVRGIIYPVVTSRLIKVDIFHYFRTVGARLAVTALITYAIFSLIRDHVLAPVGWPSLVGSVAMAAFVFFLFGPLLFFRASQVRDFVTSIRARIRA